MALIVPVQVVIKSNPKFVSPFRSIINALVNCGKNTYFSLKVRLRQNVA
jgi:hypothetical protein